MKVPFIIYADLESLLEKMNTCYNNLKKSSATKIYKHTSSDYSGFSDTTKNRLDYYRGKNYIKNFCLDLREHAIKISTMKKRNHTINKRRKENTL